MRHRTYKLEHRPASLRPTVAAAMVRLAEIKPNHVVLDPMCGAGTLVAEHLTAARDFRVPIPAALVGDLDFGAVRAAAANLRSLGSVHLARWDAARLPLATASVDRVLCNPPFGKQLGAPAEIGPLYGRVVAECDRVLRVGGRVVFLVSRGRDLKAAAETVGWKPVKRLSVRVLGQAAVISVWRKDDGRGTVTSGE
jgi:23S rRNA G2445 N2-methylase RlmL